MKRVVCFALALLLLGGGRAWAETPESGLSVSAPSAILMEKETGTVLFAKNAEEPGFPASVTKIMTMLLIIEAMESGAVSADDIVTASARAASFGGSCVYLEQGEQMSVRDMLKCIAVVSANDCAVAMAEYLCGTEEVFVRRMNERAKELGLKNTHFSNCTGLFDDGEHFTTAYDVALMSRELICHEGIKEYTGIWMDSIRDGSFELANTNKLVYWYPGCTGLKTGFTSEAMYCLSASAERDGVEYIAVIMHGDSIESRNADAKALLNYAFANFTLAPLPADDELPEVSVAYGVRASVPLTLEDGCRSLLVPKGGGDCAFAYSLSASLNAPLRKGEEAGELIVTRGDAEIARRTLVVAQDVERIGFWGILGRLAGSLVGL